MQSRGSIRLFESYKIRSILLFILLFYLLASRVPPRTLAQEKILFYDDFETLEENVWQKFENEGNVLLEDSFLKLSSTNANSFPYFYLKPDSFSFPNKPYSVIVKFRYPILGPWGTGIALGRNILENGRPLSSYDPDKEEISLISIWQETTGGFRIVRRKCTNNNCVRERLYPSSSSVLHETGDHVFRFDYFPETETAEISLDEIWSATLDSFPAISTIWLGNPFTLDGMKNWTSLYVDFVKVVSSGQNFTSVILIPGLGASWNTEAILKGEKEGQESWSMTPFVRVYDNLLNTLETAGYQRNSNLFVFNYDWRQPVAEIAQQLDSFITNNSIETPLNLIGHSLGGLVARAYWQNGHEENIEKIITLGTPHQGVVQAYEALAGGVISENTNWESVALSILLRLRYPFHLSMAEILREETPVLFDLTPLLDFFKVKSQIVPLSQLSFQNSWLKSLNETIPGFSQLDFLSGNTGINTTEWLLAKPRGIIEEILGTWPDGVPYERVKGEGDQTVLFKSSYLEDKTPYSFSINHRFLPSQPESVEKILELLDINATPVISTELFPRNNSLIFLVASPVVLQVITPDNQTYDSDSEGFVAIPSPQEGMYRVLLQGIGSGEYHLLVGQLFEEDVWSSYTGSAEPDQQIVYDFNIFPSSPLKEPLLESLQQYLTALQEEIKNLQTQHPSSFLVKAETLIEEILTAADQEKWCLARIKMRRLIRKIFAFRQTNFQLFPLRKSEEAVALSGKALALLGEKTDSCRLKQAKRSWRFANRFKGFTKRTLRLRKKRGKVDPLSALAFQKGEAYLKEAQEAIKESLCSSAQANSFLAILFFQETLRH